MARVIQNLKELYEYAKRAEMLVTATMSVESSPRAALIVLALAGMKLAKRHHLDLSTVKQEILDMCGDLADADKPQA
jgi:hypothetical protein